MVRALVAPGEESQLSPPPAPSATRTPRIRSATVTCESPSPGHPAVKAQVAADQYTARLDIDIGSVRRWLILEGLPALLANLESLSALVLMGRGSGE